MSGVELIAAALAAGASAGLTSTASAAVGDAYAGLKGLLGRRLVGRRSAAVLETEETDAGTWQTRLGADLLDSGAADDEDILAAARALLARADPATAKTFNIHIQTSHGAAGEFHAPVTFHQGPPVPPAPPAVP
ncbi:MAG: hypothetical protein HKP61_20950 [Dactylosporangium sp.]|nr:hypothetical protein [Dactylosporangium sp.]NNJ63351.1 hypothetical protein [Dactylosporangium sp.]